MMDQLRGFSADEFKTRTERAQRLMHEQRLQALVVMTEAEVEYFSGFNTPMWQSPTRPWFLVLPLNGNPIAVVPSIGAKSFETTWVTDIRSWASPQPNDEGVSLLAQTLREVCQPRSRVGFLLGPETHLRMPGRDFERLTRILEDTVIVDATPIVRSLRMIKSPSEIRKIEVACGAVSQAFEGVPNWLSSGMSELEACRTFRKAVLDGGADDIPFLIGCSGPNGTDDHIRLPSTRLLSGGDIMFFDTGASYDGYFSDFNRDFAIGHASEEARRSYEVVHAATLAGIQSARPGATTGDIWGAMAAVLGGSGNADIGAGRMGHGLGLRGTEWPSIVKGDDTVLAPGMVLAIEPGVEFAQGKILIREENIVVEQDGARLLSRLAPAELTIIR